MNTSDSLVEEIHSSNSGNPIFIVMIRGLGLADKWNKPRLEILSDLSLNGIIIWELAFYFFQRYWICPVVLYTAISLG
jgi:hypothetical protein